MKENVELGTPPTAERERSTDRASATAAPRRRSSRRLWRGVAGALAFGLLLELVTRSGLVSARFLPPFSEIVANVFLLFGREDFLSALGVTLGAWLLAFVITVVIGVSLGVALGLSDLAYRMTRTLIDIIRPLPAIAMIPLILLILGRGLETALVVTVLGSVWPVLFNTIAGVHDVDPLAKQMARVFAYTRPQVLTRVVLPSASPFIAVGIRLSASVALISVVTVELIAGGSGLGAFIGTIGATGNSVALVYAAIVVTGLLGLAINFAMELVQNRVFAWQQRTVEG